MKSGLNINIKQSQKLVMTQSLRQSIEMLQMSTIELSELISQEFLENPMLEDVSAPRSEDYREDMVNRNLSGDEADNTSAPEGDVPENSYDADIAKNYDEDDKNRHFLENAVTTRESLKDHLLWQARMTAADNDELDLYEEIITLLDDNGFIKYGDLASITHDKLDAVVDNINHFDPVGCAAHGVRESLLIQSKYFFPEDPVLHKMIAEHFGDIEKLDYNNISKAMELPLNTVIEKSRLLQNLNPFPGRSFSGSDIKYVIPDIEVKLLDGEIIITLNDDWLPNISLNGYYMNMMNNKSVTKEHYDYLNSKLQSARALIKNIEGRRETIIKVVSSVMKHQREFLEKGPGNLKYLTHHDVASEVEVHESTVSRVCSSKYVQTSWGSFELKYFFVSRLKSPGEDVDEDQSSDRVKGLIQAVITEEDPEKPYSDEELVILLKEKGVTVARRTVAKYRDILNIPSSSKRKKINMIKS